MFYSAIVTPDHGALVVTFPDAPGCVTQVDRVAQLMPMATEALAGWLDASLVAGDVVPAPGRRPRAPRGSRTIQVPVVPEAIALRVLLRRARADTGLSQVALARRLGVSAYAVRALERSGAQPTLAIVNRVAAAFRLTLVSGAALRERSGVGYGVRSVRSRRR